MEEGRKNNIMVENSDYIIPRCKLRNGQPRQNDNENIITILNIVMITFHIITTPWKMKYMTSIMV